MVACKPAASNLVLSESALQMVVGDIHMLDVKGAQVQVEWTSSDEDVAEVVNGVITAVSIGKAQITATAGKSTAVCDVFVSGTDGATLRITPAAVSLERGETVQLKCGNTYGLDVEWSSSDESIATVSADGVVTAVRGGNATITVKTELETATALAAVAHQWNDYQLVWSDEFDGNTLNMDNWNIEVNGNGGGNNEAQYYTDRPENLRVEDGNLIIELLKEEYKGKEYTSGRINSKNKRTFTYGKIEASINLPSGGGTWPAFWMLGNSGGWPKCGEIDIMEYVGNVPNRVLWTLHSTNDRGGGKSNKAAYLTDIENHYHTYGIEWMQEEMNGHDVIKFYVDGEVYNTQTEGKLEDQDSWPFNRPHFIILNLAVGGTLGGHIDDSMFEHPVQMKVDWVRVYQRTEKD